MCIHFSQVRMSNLILVDHQGQVIEGDYAVNRQVLFCTGRSMNNTQK